MTLSTPHDLVKPNLRRASGAATGPRPTSSSEVVLGSALADLQAIYEPSVQLVTAPIPIPPEVVEHLGEARPRWGWQKIIEVDGDDQPNLDGLRSLEASSAPGAEGLRVVTGEVLEVMALLFGPSELGFGS